MLFTGSHDHTIDAKHRLAIPAEIRARWRNEVDGVAWYAVPWQHGLIRLYTERDFERVATSRPLSLTPTEDEAELQASLFGLSRRLEIDAAGRIRLPEDMLRLVRIGSEVTLVGAGDRLEIRDRATWQESIEQRFKQMPGLVNRVRANGAVST